MKISQLTTTFAVLMLLLVVSVSAQSFSYNYSTPNNTTEFMTITDVDVNNFDDFPTGSILQVERGQDLDIKVTVKAGALAVENAQIETLLAGYKYADYEKDSITDYSETFDLNPGRSDVYTLHLKVPTELDKDNIELRIRLTDRNNPTIEYLYTLDVQGVKRQDALQIKKFFVSPSTTVEAGRALSFKVQVENYGDKNLKDVDVQVSIPELGLSTYETIDKINKDDVESFEALLLRIPMDVKAGEYNVVAKVNFDKYQSEEMSKTITVVAREPVKNEDKGSSKTIVTMPQAIEVSKGTSGAVYPIMINNKDDTARTYVLSITGTDNWATVEIQPSNVVVVSPGQSQTVYVNLKAADDAEAGDHVFQVTITSGNDVSTSNVVATLKGATSNDNDGLRNVLEWALVILVIILILLGLIVLIAKVKKGDKEDDEDSETYY